jgi:hypothetical protein
MAEEKQVLEAGAEAVTNIIVVKNMMIAVPYMILMERGLNRNIRDKSVLLLRLFASRSYED